jgi:ferredoxin--NADP+ reductase
VTGPAPYPRAIATDHELYNASLVRRVDDTSDLAVFWVRFDGQPTPFEPGQYMTIGVVADGKILQRPYSVASSPRDVADGYEMYIKLVPVGNFTDALWRVPVGQRMRMIGPKGRFTLEPDDDRIHFFISTGTGIAPFISMMRTLLVDARPRRVIMLNGVSYEHDLGYRALLEGWQQSGEYPVTYVPTVSRPADPANAGWRGRTGRAEANVAAVCEEHALTPANTVAYICGNPDMIVNAEQVLLARGFAAEQVKKELYWPKAREPKREEAAAAKR